MFAHLLTCLAFLAAGASAQDPEELFVRRSTWAESMIASRLAYQGEELPRPQLGEWWMAGPLEGKGFGARLFPEEGVELTALDAEGQPRWSAQPGFADGRVHALPQGGNSVYLYRTLTSEAAITLPVSLGSDDGCALWLNGEKIHKHNVARGVAPDQDTVLLPLRAGENTLLLKIFNRGGACGVYFRLMSDRRPWLWQRLSAAFPALCAAMERDLDGGHLAWFEPADDGALEETMIAGARRSMGLDAEMASLVRLSPLQRLERYVSVCATRDAYTGRQELRSRLESLDFAALRRAIEDLHQGFGERYPRGAEFLGKLGGEWPRRATELAEALEWGDAAEVEAARSLLAEIRAALLANPLLEGERLLVVRRRFGEKARQVMGGKIGAPNLNSHTNDDIPHRGWDNELALLSDPGGQPRLDPLHRPPDGEILRDVDLDFDASRIMFSSIGASDRWALFELSAEGGEAKQISPTDLPDVDFFDSCWLPDGRVATCSTAGYQGLPCENGGRPMVNLYRLDPRSQRVEQLTFEQDSDYHPAVLHNGRLVYLRWEYSDIQHYYSRIVFHCNPDGTNQREYWGSGSYFPTAFKHALPIPDHPTALVGILGGHHSIAESGRMAILDPILGRKYPLRHRPESIEWGPPGSYIDLHPQVFPASVTGMVQEIPGYGKEVVGNVHDGQGNEPFERGTPHFVYPYPLSEKYFLVSAKPTPESLWGIYLVDVFDNVTLLHEEEGAGLFEPIPFQARTRPPIVSDQVDYSRDSATVLLVDVYEGPGLAGVPRGVVKSLRLFAYHFAFNQCGGHTSVGVESSWDIKRLLGTVPVEEDGSAHFEIPANTPISIQPLDAEGRAVQLMRSWFVGRPGETLSCVGCHEGQNYATPERHIQAALRAPSPIEELNGPARPFAFPYEVHPILERRCVGCHGGQRTEAGDELLSFAESREAYDNLHPYVRRPGPESDLEMLRPMEYHASTSPLMQILEKGHHGVRLGRVERELLHCWIDLNAPWRGSWKPKGWRGQDQQARRVELAVRFSGGVVDPEAEYAALESSFATRAKAPPVLPEAPEPHEAGPANLAGWPFDEETARARQAAAGEPVVLELGENPEGEVLAVRFLRIPAGRFVMGSSTGYPDEAPASVVEIGSPFWMSELEIGNDIYALYDPVHDTRYYDEHGKDQAVPGYIGNHGAQPVARISWLEAQAFCEWMSGKIGKKVVLPTEAQWEWAARAGTDTPFYYGELDAEFSGLANLSDHTRLFTKTGWDGGSKIHVRRSYDPEHHFPLRDDRSDDGCLATNYAGSYRANAWGLRDMIGNVCEWTRTSYRPYPYSAADGRNDGDPHVRKVARGGSWHDRPVSATASTRTAYEPWQKVFNVGFRVVIEND